MRYRNVGVNFYMMSPFITVFVNFCQLSIVKIFNGNVTVH